MYGEADEEQSAYASAYAAKAVYEDASDVGDADGAVRASTAVYEDGNAGCVAHDSVAVYEDVSGVGGAYVGQCDDGDASSYVVAGYSEGVGGSYYMAQEDDPEPVAKAPAPKKRAQGVHADGAPVAAVAKDFHSLYVALLEQFARDKTLENAKAIVALANEFTAEAVKTAQQLVREKELPEHARTMRPLDVGGIAGGVKFAVRGIFFKFAVDENGLYGDDQVAGKVASREMMATNFLLDAVSRLELPIFFPLLCCVSFRGRTVLCSTTLPIGKNSLIYGSQDGGQRCLNEDVTFELYAKKLAARLNLAKHICGKNKQSLYFAADVEGHRGSDGRYYLIDTARTFPAEPARPGSKHAIRSAHLVRLLRPELVEQWKEPLSSDALSAFQALDPNRLTLDAKVREAAAHLHDLVIPHFFERLVAIGAPSAWSRELHLFGLNVRHLGVLHQMAVAGNHQALQSEILREIVIRSVKNYWRLNASSRAIDFSSATVVGAIQALALRDFGLPADQFARFDLSSLTEAILSQRCLPERSVVKNLYALSFNVALLIVEKAKSSVSLEESRDGIAFYEKTLQNFASVVLLQNYGVACLELVRKLESSVMGDSEECVRVLTQADRALSTSVAVLEAHKKTENSQFCETLMNWAAVARFQRQFVQMEERIRRATSSSYCTPLLRGNGAFFLARYAYDAGDMEKLKEQKKELIRLSEDEKNDVAIYDCGVVHFWLNELEESIPFFSKATKNDGTKAGALYMMAILRLQLGQLVECMSVCDQCVAFDPSFQKANIIYSKASLRWHPESAEERLDALKRAATKLQSIAEESTFGGEVYFLLGQCYRELYFLSRHAPLISSALLFFRECLSEGYYDKVMALIHKGLTAADVATTLLRRCDVCGSTIYAQRQHCEKCGDYDLCEGCFAAHGHEHPTVAHEPDPQVADLVLECKEAVLEALQSVEPNATTLEQCALSQNAGCARQAADTIAKLAPFAK